MALLSNFTITFRLNNGLKIIDQNKKAYIYIRVKKGREIDFKASLGIPIYPKYWNAEKKTVRTRAVFKEKNEIQSLLASITSHLENEIFNYQRQGKLITVKTVKRLYNEFYTPIDNTSYKFFDFVDNYINEAKANKPITKATITSYQVTRNILKRFNDEVYKIDFEDITLDFYYDFIRKCESIGYSKNYIGKQIKILKTFMNEALDKGVTDNSQFKSNKFVTLKEQADNIYLSTSELMKMWELELSRDDKLERARDLFLIGAFTGLRVSDYNNIAPTNITTIKGVDILQIKTRKTSQKVAIPLHPIVKSILERHNGNAPKKMPDQHINRYIKQIGKMAQINEQGQATQTKGGKVVTSKKPKYEMIKTHTARRSFCTNAYLAGMNSIEIMAISGHKTQTAFLTYIKATAEQNAIKMAEHPFFKEATNLKVVK